MQYLYALQRLPPRNTLRALHLQQSGEKGLHPEPKPAHAADACILLQLHSCDPFGQHQHEAPCGISVPQAAADRSVIGLTQSEYSTLSSARCVNQQHLAMHW